MAACSDMAGVQVDDIGVFSRFVRVFYTNCERFLDGFCAIQRRTCTSFCVYESKSGVSWLRIHPGVLSEMFSTLSCMVFPCV